MGQKCSCLCNKEIDNTYNFYPENAMNEGEYQASTVNAVKGMNKNAAPLTIDQQRLTSNPNPNIISTPRDHKGNLYNEETKKLLISSIPSIIKLQALARGFIVSRQFKRSQSYMEKDSKTKKTDLVKSFINEKIKKSHEMMKDKPFNKYKWQEEEYIGMLTSEELERINFIMSNFENKQKANSKSEKIFQDIILKSSKSGNNSILYSGYINIDQQRNGYGVLYKKTGEIYEGNWIANKFTGYGRVTVEDGSVTEGKFFF